MSRQSRKPRKSRKKPPVRSRSKSRGKPPVRTVSKSAAGLKKFELVTTRVPLTELQHRARSLGIPFGGLSKSKLVKKINAYRWS